MNLDINQEQTYITAPDDTSAIVREAIPPPAQPKVVIPNPSDRDPAAPSGGRAAKQSHANFYGLRLAWRGLYVLGSAFGIAGAWFVTAWIKHGRLPLIEHQLKLRTGWVSTIIRAPEWLLAITGFLFLISLGMLLLGTQDVTPKMTHKKD
jgi:hypothetical protein